MWSINANILITKRLRAPNNVNVIRISKDGDEWMKSESIGRDDLLLWAKAIDLAHTWIFQEAS